MTRETGATEEETAPSVGYRIEGGGRWRGRRIERSYENKAKPEGGVRYAHATIDTQDRRSNFRSCHSDASWHVSPRLLHAFTHTLQLTRAQRSAMHALQVLQLYIDTFTYIYIYIYICEPCALHVRSDVTSRHDHQPHARMRNVREMDAYPTITHESTIPNACNAYEKLHPSVIP